MADFYTGVAGYYPLSAFSQFNRLADSTQVFFYILTKGALVTPEEWSAQMQASVAQVRSTSPNFFKSTAVKRSPSAALGACSASFHKIAAHPSGVITEYTEFSIIKT